MHKLGGKNTNKIRLVRRNLGDEWKSWVGGMGDEWCHNGLYWIIGGKFEIYSLDNESLARHYFFFFLRKTPSDYSGDHKN